MIEYRVFEGGEMRADVENRHVSGYGIVFNSDSQPMHVWDDQRGIVQVVERIVPESLRDAEMNDVISAFNHDFSKVLGRTTSGTLTLKKDERGVFYRAKAPKTTYADDLIELVGRGDVRGSSFVFTMDYEEGYDIQERDDGKLVAIPKKIKRVYEMGPVTNPAYPETTAENRTGQLEEAVKRFLKEKKEQRDEDTEQAEKREETPTDGPDTQDTADVAGGGPDAGMQERQETPITYPFPKGYWNAKARVKKRV